MHNYNLRPLKFEDFIGQHKLIKTLKAMIKSSQIKEKVLSHILFYAPPGMGKTTLATIIANETNKNIHYIQGANIEKKADIINILSIIKEGDIVFIDEIHSINKNVIEFLYSAIEDFVFDLIIGVEGNSKALRMKIKPFTMIGATTKINEIPQPFKDRFGYIARLVPYNEKDILSIIKHSGAKLKLKVPLELQKFIAQYARLTPRIANHLLERISDFAIAENEGVIDLKTIQKTFKNLDLYQFGLTKDHIEYLEILRSIGLYKSASLDTITGISIHSRETILNEIEPILIYFRFIEKNSRGRKITEKGINYLKEQLK